MNRTLVLDEHSGETAEEVAGKPAVSWDSRDMNSRTVEVMESLKRKQIRKVS